MNSTLRQIPLFAPLAEEDLQQLEAILRPLELPPGELFIKEGERGDRLFIILDGQLEVIKALGLPGERVLAERGAGEFIGEMSLLESEGLRTASVRTMTRVKLLEMTRADFDELLLRRPILAIGMLRELSLRLHQIEDATIEELREKNLQLTQAYQELKAAQAQIIEKEKMERELQVARKIQESMLPRRLPQLVGFDFGARMLPARVIGGDLFDFIPYDSDHLGIVIGDVSDKGVPAALFMALTRSLLRAESSRAASPAQVLRQVNHHLLQMNEAGMFITMLYGILKRETSEFVYARAGHELPHVFDPNGGLYVPEIEQGHVLGVFPHPELDRQSLTIPPGGTLLLYTDGATDARSADGEFFGVKRLEEAARANLVGTAQQMCDGLLDEILSFQGPHSQFDDITLLAIRAH